MHVSVTFLLPQSSARKLNMKIKSFVLRKRVVGIAAAVAFAMAGAAQAEQIKQSGLGNGMASGGLLLPVQTSPSNYWTGLQSITINDGASTNSFMAFCLDPFQWSSTSYSTYTKTDLTSVFGAAKTANISALYNAGYAAALGGNLGAAALQLALWEVANDNQNLNSALVQTVTGTNASLKTATQSLLDNMGSFAGSPQYTFTLYTSTTNQDFLVAAPVPEPEIYAMMAAGLGLMGVMSRRRKQKQAAA
jgi:PEP-CTERM motif